MTPQIVSYAQNCEDVVLARLFRHQASGRYIDVGAAHPVLDSVTKHFYDRGWRGVNIEPNSELFGLLAADRPEDTNLMIAVADAPGRADLHLHGDPSAWGLATLDRQVVERNVLFARTTEVEVSTLGAVCATHLVGKSVDFLKIDVEGLEKKVILGIDWARLRPRVIVVEATQPSSTVPTHGEWEHLLVGAGYRPVLFDGLNRFYVGDGDEEAARVLSAPANVLDGYIRYDHLAALVQVEQLKASFQALRQQTSQLVEETERLRRRTENARFTAAVGPGALSLASRQVGR